MSEVVNLVAALKTALSRESQSATYGVAAPRIKQAVEAYARVRQEFIESVGLKERYFGALNLPQAYEANGERFYRVDEIVGLENEISALLEIWSQKNSIQTKLQPMPRRIFISHGRSEEWRKIQEFVERTLEIPTLELAQEANRGRSIFQKLIDESESCGYALIIMTGDDLTHDEQVRARENVIHEIGYFQGKYGPDRVCLLHEDGVNIPSNIHGLVYIPFPKDAIEAAMGGITRELKYL